MVKEPVEEPLLLDDESEEGGGPVKPFLEHLEDLRWTLIKCFSALAVSLLICLVASKYIIALLEAPLHDAARLSLGTNQLVKIMVGNRFINFQPGTNSASWAPLLGTNQYVKLRAEPYLAGTNFNVRLVPEEFAPNEVPLLVNLVTQAPFSGFSVMIKVAFYGGLGLASPFLLYFIGQFVIPALRGKEKDFLLKGAMFGGGLFLAGVFFCYKFIMPITLIAGVQISEYLSFEADEWRAEDYIGLIMKFMIGMGLAFQLPVVLLTMVKIGILDYKKLAKWRMYWVVGNMVLSALVTPSPDPLTMFIMAGALHLLYEISLFIAWLWYKKDLKKKAAEEAGAA